MAASHDRRAFLRGAGLAVGAGATLSLLGVAGGAEASGLLTSQDPDQLFRAGRFAEADRGYARLLRADPTNSRAAAQRGYIALLSNKFGDAEKYLSRAVGLAPDDIASTQRLAECFVRQDQHARAIPLLRRTGSPRDAAYAELYSHLGTTPWQVHGAQSTRVPFHAMEPLPSVEASVNGGAPKRFLLDTYGTLDLTQEVADELGLRSVATISGGVGGDPVTIHLGILDSFRLGDIELRNIPMHWIDIPRPPLPDGSQPAGVIGTTTFYHLLTTMDYAGQALVLRRKTAARPTFLDRAERLPLWLAGDHFPCTLGSLRDYGPRIVTLDTGGLANGVSTTVELAERAGIEVDYDNPNEHNGALLYPITPDRISLGSAVGRHVNGWAGSPRFGPGPAQSAMFGFDVIANYSHTFFQPFAITFDYTDMNFHITTGETGR